MTSLTVRFNQLVDLAVNPSMGTINTSLLHNLLHIVIHQLQLSSNLIEFHGAGSAAIENHIVNNRHRCGIEISQYEMRAEIDESTGITVERRREIEERRDPDETTKLFSVRNVNAVAQDIKYPMGYPLNPIQVLSIEQLQKIQTESIHDVMLDVGVSHSEGSGSPLKAMFDFINVSKRLDALEIGIRQLAELMKRMEMDTGEDIEDKSIDVMTVIEPKLTSLDVRIDELREELKKFQCKCNNDDFEINLFENFHEKLQSELEDLQLGFRTEMKELRSFYEQSATIQRQESLNQQKLKLEVCDELKVYRDELVRSMTEVQEMLDSKLDKISIPELKSFVRENFQMLEDRIENIDCKKALAAGAAKRIFKGLNCVSCGDDVIQADAHNHTKKTRHISSPQLTKRLCGGNHTTEEDVLRSKCCQN